MRPGPQAGGLLPGPRRLLTARPHARSRVAAQKIGATIAALRAEMIDMRAEVEAREGAPSEGRLLSGGPRCRRFSAV